MIFRAYIGVESLTDVGGRFYLAGATAGSRVGSATDEGGGWYSVDMGTLPAASVADHIRWDSISDATVDAREDLFVYRVNVGSINGTNVIGAGVAENLWRA
jgi:hypothetical protein